MSEKKMLPEVEQYLAAVEAANLMFETTTAALDAATKDRYSFGTEEQARLYRMYSAGVGTARGARIGAKRDAWDALKNSADPLVAWIGRNTHEYLDQSVTILRSLPATVDELDDVAHEAGWCDRWLKFRLQAQQDGVLPGLEPRPASVFELLEWVMDRGGEEFMEQDLLEFDSLIDSLRADFRRESTSTTTRN